MQSPDHRQCYCFGIPGNPFQHKKKSLLGFYNPLTKDSFTNHLQQHHKFIIHIVYLNTVMTKKPYQGFPIPTKDSFTNHLQQHHINIHHKFIIHIVCTENSLLLIQLIKHNFGLSASAQQNHKNDPKRGKLSLLGKQTNINPRNQKFNCTLFWFQQRVCTFYLNLFSIRQATHFHSYLKTRILKLTPNDPYFL